MSRGQLSYRSSALFRDFSLFLSAEVSELSSGFPAGSLQTTVSSSSQPRVPITGTLGDHRTVRRPSSLGTKTDPARGCLENTAPVPQQHLSSQVPLVLFCTRLLETRM